jgi:nitrite reductase (NO-forming)
MMTMRTLHLSFLFLILLAQIAGGCTPQPPAQAQAEADVTFTLKTMMVDGRMVFLGAGGEIDGVTNPELTAQPGDKVRVTLINEDGMPHDFGIPDLYAKTAMVTTKGQTTEVVFDITAPGEFAYYCTVPGHRQAGMEGRLVVIEP